MSLGASVQTEIAKSLLTFHFLVSACFINASFDDSDGCNFNWKRPPLFPSVTAWLVFTTIERLSDIMMMGDWQEWASACIMALVFAFMLAKLISLVASFRGGNLRVERDRDTSPSAPLVRENNTTMFERHNPSPPEHQEMISEVPNTVAKSEIPSTQEAVEASAKDNNHKGDYSSSDNDWEGIDGNELDQAFVMAASFVEKMAFDPSFTVSSNLQLQLYGLYKQATEGVCTASLPRAYKLTARAKWHAWKKLGNISPEEAMQQYISLLSELCPDWNKPEKENMLATGNQDQAQATGISNPTAKIGPVFSMPAKEESCEEDGLEEIHRCARDGDREGVTKCLEQKIPVDQRDIEGRTALHWAVDQGYLGIAELLLIHGADINAKDSEGQTPLHYAVTCEWDDLSIFLLEFGADPSIKDNDGFRPYKDNDPPYIPS